MYDGRIGHTPSTFAGDSPLVCIYYYCMYLRIGVVHAYLPIRPIAHFLVSTRIAITFIVNIQASHVLFLLSLLYHIIFVIIQYFTCVLRVCDAIENRTRFLYYYYVDPEWNRERFNPSRGRHSSASLSIVLNEPTHMNTRCYFSLSRTQYLQLFQEPTRETIDQTRD